MCLETECREELEESEMLPHNSVKCEIFGCIFCDHCLRKAVAGKMN